MNDELKRLAAEAIDSHRDELVALSSAIHATPELAFEEFRAVETLTAATRRLGWPTETGVCELATAWRATLPAASDGPVVALLCEYDALPEIGHACGHNLMAMAPIAAAVGLQAVLDRLRGRVAIVGTPAEEGGGGKVIMLQRGGLAGVEATLLVHPSSHSVVKTEALACEHYDVEFHGKAAHAAGSPEKGVNALNAMILSFNHIDALRQHILPSARIHGIIRHGGDAPNIVPEYSQGSFMIRAASNSYLDELMDKVRRCFEAAALATGCTFEWHQVSPRYETILSNPTLAGLYAGAMEQLGIDCPMESDQGFGSSDVGNVSWLIPSIQPLFKIADHIPNHTSEFTAAAASPRAHEAAFEAAKAMAFTTIDLLRQPQLLEQAKRELANAVKTGA